MANPEHLEILNKGVVAWNQWRRELIGVPDLSGAVLFGVNLNRADLGSAQLNGAKVKGSMRFANLISANLEDAELSLCDFTGADLSWASFKNANLRQTKLGLSRLLSADLSGANLVYAELVYADLGEADLTNANLDSADLTYAKLHDAKLEGASLAGVDVGATVFTNLDLRCVRGLEKMRHGGPSAVGVDTLYKSQGRIPDKFLQDAGVPEEIIDLARAIRAGPPIQWHSCFISYSTKDEEFARRLHSRMREANMRVWFAPENMKGGEKLHEQLFRAIQLYDKLLLVLSATSMNSEWVMTEIRKARETERKEKRRKLFPIRLVGFDALRDWTCFDADTGKDLAVELREYFIPDFSNWKDRDSFEAAFKRLQKDLQAQDSAPGA